jgi:hypothetical protein
MRFEFKLDLIKHKKQAHNAPYSRKELTTTKADQPTELSTTTRHQDVLLAAWNRNRRPDNSSMQELVRETGLDKKSVLEWFKKRQADARKAAMVKARTKVEDGPSI